MDVLATTHDTIYQGRLRLEQPAKGYRFGSDAMLLAASLDARPNQSVLELGCGVGAVLMAAWHRLEGVKLTGIEREAGYADLAEKNIRENKAEDRVNVYRCDLMQPMAALALGSFDHVIANPPYYETGSHSGAETDLRRVARQHEPGDLAVWLQVANRMLRPKGSVTFIHATEKLDELITGLQKFCGAITIMPLWPQQDQPSKRVIIRGTKGSKAPLALLPGLVLHQVGGGLTPRADHIINHGRNLWSDDA